MKKVQGHTGWRLLAGALVVGASAFAVAVAVSAAGTQGSGAGGALVKVADVADYDLDKGRRVYRGACAACHDDGVAGAPKTGDTAAWEARIDQGLDVLIERSIEGFTGDAGFMPPRGGHAGLSDEEVGAATAYMVDESQ